MENQSVGPCFREKMWKYKNKYGDMIPLLQEAQEEYGYVPLRVIHAIAAAKGSSVAEVFGVLTFYAQFRLEPLGQHLIRICEGTACHVNGAKLIVEAINGELGISVGETTSDGLFTLLSVACIGCCSLAPVMMIDDETFGKLNAAKLKKAFKKYKDLAAAIPAKGDGEQVKGVEK